MEPSSNRHLDKPGVQWGRFGTNKEAPDYFSRRVVFADLEERRTRRLDPALRTGMTIVASKVGPIPAQALLPGKCSPYTRFVLISASLLTLVVLAVTVQWIVRHPYPIGWDEGLYFEFVNKDLLAFKAHGLHGIVSSFRYLDPSRPPFFRIAAAPSPCYLAQPRLRFALLAYWSYR